MKKQRRGGGMTERQETLLPATGANVRSWFDQFSKVRGWTFEGGVTANGIESLFVDWLERPETRPPLVAGPDGEHSAEWFAEVGLRYLSNVRQAISQGNADQAARWAMQLGALCGRLEMKQDWERPALSGAKAATGAARGGKLRTTDARDVALAREWLEAVDMAQASGRPKPSRATIGKRFGLQESASIKAVSRGLKLIEADAGK